MAAGHAWKGNTERLNQLIVVPTNNVLRADDGRTFLIKSWEVPRIEAGQLVIVSCDLIPRLPEENVQIESQHSRDDALPDNGANSQ